MHISALVKLNLYEVANYAIWNDCRLRVTLLSHLALVPSLICTYIIYTNSRIFGINWYRTVWSTGTWSVLAQSNFGFSQWFTQHLRNLMGPNPSCWEIQPLNTIEPLMWGQPTSLWAGLWLKKSSIKETCRKAQVPEHFWIFNVWWLPNCHMSAFRGSYEYLTQMDCCCWSLLSCDKPHK